MDSNNVIRLISPKIFKKFGHTPFQMQQNSMDNRKYNQESGILIYSLTWLSSELDIKTECAQTFEIFLARSI